MPNLVRQLLDCPPVPARRLSWTERREAREEADANLVWAWLDRHPNAPLGALHACIPLSGRRLRRALGKLIAEEGWL